MAHGLPDDSDVESSANVYKSLDVSELAIRLGMLPSFDRQGDVVYFNDFGGGPGILTISESVGGTSLSFCNTAALSSGVSAEMVVAGSEDDYAVAQGTLLLNQAGGVGIELLFTIESGVKSVSLYFQVITGGQVYLFWVDIVIATGLIYYYDDSGAWVEVGEHTFTNPQTTHLHSAKLVIDRESLTYARLIYNGVTYLLRDIAPYHAPSASSNQLLFEGRFRAGASGNCVAYLAGLIVTQNEPL